MNSKKDVRHRVASLLQTLEAHQGDDVEQLKTATSKLLQLVTSHDKVRKEVAAKSSGGVETLLVLLESSSDPVVVQNIVLVINELVGGKSSSSKRVTALINRGATQVLFNILVNVSRDVPVNEELVMSLHQILAKLGPKDRKFEVKARLSGALGVTLNLVRNHANYFKTLQPALYVLKIYANNAVNASQLGKAGAVSYMFRVIQMCGKKHVTQLKLALDVLALLCKSKSNASRLVSMGGVALLIGLYSDWHRFDSSNRHVNIRKSILGALKQIANLKSGRKSFVEADGIRVLYCVCIETLDSRELEGAVNTASVIMRKCLPRSRLPVPSVASPLTFSLPDSDYRRLSHGGGSDSQEDNDSASDDDDDDDEDDDGSSSDVAGGKRVGGAVPGRRAAAAGGKRAAAAAAPSSKGSGKKSGKPSSSSSSSAAAHRQSLSELAAQRRKSGLFSQDSLERDDDDVLRFVREAPRSADELRESYAEFFPELYEFGQRYLKELASMDSDESSGADSAPRRPDSGVADAASIKGAVGSDESGAYLDSTQSTLVDSSSNTLLSVSDSCCASTFGISDSLGSLKLMDCSGGGGGGPSLPSTSDRRPGRFNENGAPKLPSLSSQHRLKSYDSIDDDNDDDDAVTPAHDAATPRGAQTTPLYLDGPAGLHRLSSVPPTPLTAELTPLRVPFALPSTSPISKSQSWPLAINAASPPPNNAPYDPGGARLESGAVDAASVAASCAGSAAAAGEATSSTRPQALVAPPTLGPLKTNGRPARPALTGPASTQASVVGVGQGLVPGIVPQGVGQTVQIKSVSSRPLMDLPPPSGSLQYHLSSPPAPLRLGRRDVPSSEAGNPLGKLMIQGGSVGNRGSELHRAAELRRDDSDFDYEPARSRRRVSSASSDRGGSGEDESEASPERFLPRQSSLPQGAKTTLRELYRSAVDSAKQPHKRSSRLRPGSYCGLSHGSYIDLDAELGLPDPGLVTAAAKRTNSVGWFNKVAYPDLYGHKPPTFQEPLYDRKVGVQRAKIFEDIDRLIHPEDVINRVVYDQDAVIATKGPLYCGDNNELTNDDESRVGVREFADHLLFNAQFEAGNLRKAIQAREYEYDLILNPDVNTNHHHQWFYFQVSNMEPAVPYRFNIINCEKQNSQFNFGMQPVCFSVFDAMHGNSRWTRVGTDVCYYRNHFARSPQTTGGAKGKTYFTTTFTVSFKHPFDVCYLAYHYPFTYTTLVAQLDRWESTIDKNDIYYRRQTLCRTLNENKVEVLTLTSNSPRVSKATLDDVASRPHVFLTARVHPGESNASWLMKGTLQFLLSRHPTARSLRDQFIFKIVPMLNPEGVINGCHRTSLGAEDLNRTWSAPCSKLHAPIYHTKGLLHFLNAFKKPPVVFCDMHGHSRRKNVFLYGCSPSLSWCSLDSNRIEDSSYKILPRVLQHIAPSFSIQNSAFVVEKAKEATARVVVWRQFGVNRSYTMESTYCGLDQGPYRGLHVSTRHLEEMGQKFAEALLKLNQKTGFKSYALTVNLEQAFASHDLQTARFSRPSKSDEEATQSEDDDDDDDEDPHDYEYYTP